MRAGEAVAFSNISATTAAFALEGGMYQVDFKATWGGGSATLQQLGPDDTTWLSVSNAQTVDGGQTLYLPPGQFRVSITTATALYSRITRVPLE